MFLSSTLCRHLFWMHENTNTRTHTHTHTFTHARSHVHAHALNYTYAHKYKGTHPHRYTLSHAHTGGSTLEITEAVFCMHGNVLICSQQVCISNHIATRWYILLHAASTIGAILFHPPPTHYVTTLWLKLHCNLMRDKRGHLKIF